MDDYGALDDTTIDYGSKSFAVGFLQTVTGQGSDYITFTIDNAVEFLPRGTVFNFGGTEFTADADQRSIPKVWVSMRWDLPANFGWIDGQKVRVSANLAPAPESATVDGTTLVLTHAEDLDTTSTPADAYTVKVNGSDGPDVTDVSVGTRTVTLTLAMAVTAADIVTVKYDVPTSNRLRDASDLDAPAFDNFPVTNNTGVTTTAPAIVTNGVQVRSTPIATPDTYGLGETIEITVTFDNAVTVDTSSRHAPDPVPPWAAAHGQVGRVQQRFGGHGPGVHLYRAVR